VPWSGDSDIEQWLVWLALGSMLFAAFLILRTALNLADAERSRGERRTGWAKGDFDAKSDPRTGGEACQD